MAIQVVGPSTNVLEVESSKAIRTTPRPMDVLGSYAIDTTTGTMAAGLGAAAPVYSFRWTQANAFALLRTVRVAMIGTATAFTAGTGLFELIAARNFNTSDSAGTSILPTSNNQKVKTAHAITLVTDLRQSSTATLTAGTRTLDAQPLASLVFTVPVTASIVIQPTTVLWQPDFAGDWPLVMAQNEGFIIRATVPATGTWTMRVGIEWQEVSSF